MNQESALVPQLISQRGNRAIENVLSIVIGVVGLSLLAQIAIPLPWTPVPITGQTFGVALAALLWGRKRGVAVVLSYLFLGSLGLPIFALGKSGMTMGPTAGYLLGMVIATYWMGMLADFGWTKTYLKSWLAATSGSLIIFAFGAAVLSFFVPTKDILVMGVLPFLPGDSVKTAIASFLAFRAQKSAK